MNSNFELSNSLFLQERRRLEEDDIEGFGGGLMTLIFMSMVLFIAAEALLGYRVYKDGKKYMAEKNEEASEERQPGKAQ